jgi:hypothetical protein
LIVIFARLMHQNLNNVIQFLESKGALEFVLNVWCDTQDSFFAYDSKVCAIALAKLFLT